MVTRHDHLKLVNTGYEMNTFSTDVSEDQSIEQSVACGALQPVRLFGADCIRWEQLYPGGTPPIDGGVSSSAVRFN